MIIVRTKMIMTMIIVKKDGGDDKSGDGYEHLNYDHDVHMTMTRTMKSITMITY